MLTQAIARPERSAVSSRAEVRGHDFRNVQIEREGQKMTYLRTNRGLRGLADYYPMDVLQDLKGRRVLDAGTGGGRFVTQLRAQGVDAIGLDIHLNESQKKHAHFVQADMRHTPFREGEFDVVFSTLSVLHYEGDNPVLVRDILAEFKRVLRPGGKILLSPNHATLMEAIRQTPGLRIVRSEGTRFVEIEKR